MRIFFYIDGVNTIIHMSTSYGDTLGLDSTSMLLALLLVQVLGLPFCLLYIKASERFGARAMVGVGICIYMGVTVFGFFLREVWQFWVMAVMVATSQGGIQALSRSMFGKMIPDKKRTGEFFGFYDIFGKFSAIMGPALVGWSSALAAGIMLKNAGETRATASEALLAQVNMDAAPWGILSVLIIFFHRRRAVFLRAAEIPQKRRAEPCRKHIPISAPRAAHWRRAARRRLIRPPTRWAPTGRTLCLPTMCCKTQKRRPYDLAALGERMHEEQTGRFLRAMVFRAWSEAQRSYTPRLFKPLCSRFHPCTPMWEALCAPGGVFGGPYGHGFCEAALDSELHEQDGHGRAVPQQDAAPALSPKALAEVCELLHACILEVYGLEISREALADCFHDFAWLHGMFCAGAGKRLLIRAVQFFMGRPGWGMSHVTPARRRRAAFRSSGKTPLPMCSSKTALRRCWRRRRSWAASIKKAAAAYWEGVLDKVQLAAVLGDRSYLSGLLSRGPEDGGDVPGE